MQKLSLCIMLLGFCVSGFVLLRGSGECELLKKLGFENDGKSSLIFALKLSGCGCVSEYENLQQWKLLFLDLKKNKGFDFRAYALQNNDSSLQELYGFKFEFNEGDCHFKKKSLTILMNSGKVIFKKEGALSMNDYYLLKKHIKKQDGSRHAEND